MLHWGSLTNIIQVQAIGVTLNVALVVKQVHQVWVLDSITYMLLFMIVPANTQKTSISLFANVAYCRLQQASHSLTSLHQR